MSYEPNPGSDKALKAGCLCPVLDNSHGQGYMGISGQFVYSELCPIHGSHVTQDREEGKK